MNTANHLLVIFRNILLEKINLVFRKFRYELHFELNVAINLHKWNLNTITLLSQQSRFNRHVHQFSKLLECASFK